MALGFIPPKLSSHRSNRGATAGRSSKDGTTCIRSLATTSAGRHPLILDGLCLHVLSSFQRTGAQDEPKTPSWGSTSGDFSVRRRTLQIYDIRQPFVNPKRAPLRQF